MQGTDVDRAIHRCLTSLDQEATMAAPPDAERRVQRSPGLTVEDFVLGALSGGPGATLVQTSGEPLTFEYRPGGEEREARSAGMKALDRIEESLPDAPRAIAEPLGSSVIDYPIIKPEWATADSWQCRDGSGRLVFCIAGQLYFRRYNDAWNPLVMQSYVLGSKIEWGAGGLGDKALIALADAL